MKPIRLSLSVVLCLCGLATADEKKPSLVEETKVLASLPDTGWLSEAVPVALEAKELGGKKDDKLRLAIRFRQEKEGAKGTFTFGLAQPDDKDAKVIHRPLSGKFELTEKEGKRVLVLAVEEGAKEQTVRIPYALKGKQLTFLKGIVVEGWEKQGVKVFLNTDKTINLGAR